MDTQQLDSYPFDVRNRGKNWGQNWGKIGGYGLESEGKRGSGESSRLGRDYLELDVADDDSMVDPWRLL